METKPENAHQGERITFTGLLINTLLGLIQLIGSFLGHSSALMADAIHTFSDCLSDLVVYISLKFSHQPADENHPYGHGKIETLATTFVGIIMVIAGGSLILEYIDKIIQHKVMIPTPIALIPIVLTIVFKESMFHYQNRKGKHLNLPSLIANSWHHRSDALSSIAVLLGVSGSLIGFKNLDIAAGLIVAHMILGYGIYIIYGTSKELVETSIDQEEIQKIEQIVFDIQEVKKISQVRARNVGSRLIIDLTIHVDGQLTVHQAHDIADHVENRLMKKPIQGDDVIVHVEPID